MLNGDNIKGVEEMFEQKLSDLNSFSYNRTDFEATKFEKFRLLKMITFAETPSVFLCHEKSKSCSRKWLHWVAIGMKSGFISLVLLCDVEKTLNIYRQQPPALTMRSFCA